MCSEDRQHEICTSSPQDQRGYTCGRCPEIIPESVGSEWISPFDEIQWQKACDEESNYDYIGTLKFCQEDENTFGYRLRDGDACSGLAPLIRMQAGKRYQLRLQNQGYEDTNIHTHGLHIPGSGNSDDVNRRVSPGNCLFYNWTVPPDHMDGSFWYHAHLQSRTRAQVSGGALGVLIVDPPEKSPHSRPYWVEHNERILLLTTISDGFTLANGKRQETMQLEANTWHYLRATVADPKAKVHDILFDETFCEARAVAYDGVWRSKVPHPVAAPKYTLSGANRIDFAIKCSESSGLYFDTPDTSSQYDPLVRFAVSGNGNDGALDEWIPPRPLYLQDLTKRRDLETTFNVNIGLFGINGRLYDPRVPLKTFEHGSLQQWNIEWSNYHPFHLHLYHMQIVTKGGCGNIFEEGEWYDSIASVDRNCLVRFRFLDIGGQAMMHCHKLLHEDMGLMGWVNVTNSPPSGVVDVDEMKCYDEKCYSAEPPERWSPGNI